MSKAPKKKRKKLTAKAILGLIFVLAFIVVFVCIGITWRYINDFDDSHYGTAFTLTHTASEYIDGEKVIGYYENRETDDYYVQVQESLELLRSEGDLNRMYVFVPLENEIVTIWSTDSDGNALGVRQVFEGEFKKCAMGSFSDDSEQNVYFNEQNDNKLVVTSFSPIRDKGGKPIALVASEFQGENIIIKIAEFNLATLGIVLVSSIIPILIFYRKTKKGVLMPIKRLNTAAKQMVGDLESEKPVLPDIHTNDEIEELSDSFGQMNRELRDYIGQLRLATAEKERIGAELNMAKDIALSHHEWWDGGKRGYPERLKGEDIPLSARIMAVADVFDALVSKRCYKNAFSYDKAFSIIKEDAGTHFDKALAEVFLSCRSELEDYYDHCS